MNDLDARVQRIERVLTNQSLLELAQRLDALQADVRTIRGEVELLQNETQGGKTQSPQSVRRSREAPGRARNAGRRGRGAGPRRQRRRRPRAASEQATYDAGMAALRGGNYDKAVATFREVVTNYPNGDLAANAQFWIGESYYTKGDLESAITAYRKVPGRLAGLAQGARRDGQARLHAVGRCGAPARRAARSRRWCASIRAPTPPSSRRIA